MDSLNTIIRAAAVPVAEPYPNWRTGADADDKSDTMNERRRLWDGLASAVDVPWLEGLRIRLYPGNEMSRIIYLTGQYEPNEFWWLKRFLKPGMTVIDAGANMGFYTLFCARLVGADGKVVALEPSDREFDRLTEHVRLNSLENVSCLKIGVGARAGRRRMKIATERKSGHNTLGDYAYQTTEHLNEQNVDLMTLDGIVESNGLTRIDLIKLDIEGAELDALNGATGVLARHRPILLVEVADRTLQHQGASAAGLLRFLHGNRYRLLRLDAGSRQLVPAPHVELHRSVNLFAVPVERVLEEEGGTHFTPIDLTWFDLVTPPTPLPEPTGWKRFWHGYGQMEKVRSQDFSVRVAQQHKDDRSVEISESGLEQQLFINMVLDNPNQHVVMVELGSGRGDWCLSLAGLIDHRMVDCSARSYDCIAVEAEPTHCEWTREHFEKQDINGTAIWGAVYSYNGVCWLSTGSKAEDHYGQSLFGGQCGVRVPCYTLREIARLRNLERIDILHMDVQGAELDIIRDSLDLFADGLVRYVMIGTHQPHFNAEIRRLLDPFMDFYFDVPCESGLVPTIFGMANLPVDGMMLGRSKVPDPTGGTGIGRSVEARKGAATWQRPGRIFGPEVSKEMSLRHLDELIADYRSEDRQLDACRAVRRWAAQRANQSEPELGTTELPATPEGCVRGYQTGEIAGVCGRTADFLAKLYGRYGFSSATINFGQSSLTHVVTLVGLSHGDREYAMVQDAYVNAEFAVEGEEVSSLSRYLVSALLSPESVALAEHFPHDRRLWVDYGDDGAVTGMRSVPMFDVEQWFYQDAKLLDRRYFASRLDKREQDVIPADMLFFPLWLDAYGTSEHLMREIVFYRHQVTTIVPYIAQFGRDSAINSLDLEASLALI